MSWYKKTQSKVKLDFISYDSHGTFKVLINDDPYTFGPLDKDFAENLKLQIRQRPWEHGNILNLLKQKYNLKNIRNNTEEEQMLSELPSQKDLWGW